MSDDFYDKVAKKFGDYQTTAKHADIFPQGNPEEIFKQKLVKLSGKEKIALDVGCADGRFTLSIASHFKKITAIDISKGMLDSAISSQNEQGISNVSFEYQSVRDMPYKDATFDIVYNRRGPPDSPQFFRVLKSGGYYLEIRIGEKDTQELKELFGRGQGYRQWSESALKKDRTGLDEAGFKAVFGQEFFYSEHYSTFNDLDLFLQGVPIFEDYDSDKDKVRLTKYVREHQVDRGIELKRHRVVTISKKP